MPILPTSQPDTNIDPYSTGPEASTGTSIPGSRVRTLSVGIAAASFVTILLTINHALFTSYIMEYGDFAANGLQIERAKHFHELLGNYSRWGFHHPGPAFMYIFAIGEALFHDLFHIVPAAMNAHILTIILLNTAFLFGTIGIVANYCKSRLFTPFAVLLSIFFIYVVNRTIPVSSALLSIWMPHVLLFCFLFFATVCGAVAMGEIGKLPLLVLSGLLLIHAHAAQPLFVGMLTALSLGTLWFRRGKTASLGELLKGSRAPVAISLALIALFVLPMVVDVVIDKPNNVEAILNYMSRHRGIQHSPGMALKYEVSFLDFVPDTQILFQASPSHLLLAGVSRPCVAAYWLLSCLMLLLLVGLYVRGKSTIPPFFKWMVVEIAVVLVLFYVWALKMGGPMVNFNGYFIYSVQLLALLLIAALILDGLKLTARPALALALCALAPLSMLAGKSAFTNGSTGDPITDRLYASIPANAGPVHFTFPAEDWTEIAGIVNRMEREHRPFCVDYAWAFQFGHDNVCRSMDGLTNLVLTRTPIDCKVPCRVLMNDAQLRLIWMPYPFLKLPFAARPDDLATLQTGFYGNENGQSWSSRRATIYFRLAHDFTDASEVRVKVLGTAIPGHPAHITLNGHSLVTIASGAFQTVFVVDRSLFMAGRENQLVIDVDPTARVVNDPRTLGFYWSGVEFAPATQ